MTHWKVLTSSSATLTAEDLGKHRPTFTITAVEGGEFKDEDDKTTGRAALISLDPVKNENPSKAETAFWATVEGKQFAARPVNCMLLEALFGPQYEGWVGCRVTIGPDRVEGVFKGALKGKPCIRVLGSPDLDETLTVSLKLPRKKQPLVRTLTPTKTAPDAQNPEALPIPNAEVDAESSPFADGDQ